LPHSRYLNKTPVDEVKEPLQEQRLRDRAEQCRELAEIMKTDESRNEYLVLARAYESLAETKALFAKLQQRVVILNR
jgi:hypothetical protein